MNNNADYIKEFEQRLAEYSGSKEAVVVDSCSNAIFLSLVYISTILLDQNLFKKEQCIPKHTYVSVPMALERARFTPRFINKPWSGIYQIGDLPIIDGAQRFTRGMYIQNTFHCLSFHEKKILKIGKGGAILTNDSHAAKILRRMAFDGRDYNIGMLDDDVSILGYHMNMPPRDAMTGIYLLNQLPDINPDSGNSNNYKDLTTLTLYRGKNA